MTQDKAKKTAIRQRMAETGEPYSVARHAVEDEYVSSPGPLESPADRLEGMTGDAGDAEAEPLSQEQAGRLAEQARYLAEQARIRAERADEAAGRAEEAIDEAEHRADVYEDGPPRWHHPSRPAPPPRPPQAPRPPRPPASTTTAHRGKTTGRSNTRTRSSGGKTGSTSSSSASHPREIRLTV